MGKYEVLSGGSGVWNLQKDGRVVASGHVPTGLDLQERVRAIRRQVAAKAAGRRPALQGRCLGGGHVDMVELDERDVDTLVKMAADSQARQEELTRIYYERRMREEIEIVRAEAQRRSAAGWVISKEMADRVMMTRDGESITITAVNGEAWVRPGEHRLV